LTDAPPINSPYIVPPGGSCVAGDTQTFYEVQQAEYASIGRGMFGGGEYAADGTLIDYRAFVWVPGKGSDGVVYTLGPNRSSDGGGAEYGGGLLSFADITDGMRLNVRGWRLANCQLEAWHIEPAP
jgi:hypothetical protein